MILPLLVAAAFGLVAWTSPRSACALADAQGVAAQDGPDVVPLNELPPLGGPVHLDQVALPGATLLDADRLVAVSKAYGAEHPDVFAGLLLAQGRLWLGFTADAATHLAAVRARVDQPDLLRAFVADFAERELRALQERITPDLTRLGDEGIDVTMVGVDVRRNRVQIGLRSVGNGAPESLARRYGAAMLVVQEDVVLRTLPAPVLSQPGMAGDGGTGVRGADVDHGGCSPQRRPEATLKSIVGRLRTECERIDRDPASLRVCQSVITAPDLDELETRALAHARAVTYLDAPGYGEMLVQLNGWDPAPLARLRDHEQLNGMQTMVSDLSFHRNHLLGPASLVPDEWMEQSCALGPITQCVQTLRRFRAAGADEIATYGSTPNQNAAVADAWRQE